MKTKISKRAFTLVELMVVMSIIAILLAMSPVFMQAAQKGIAKVRSVKTKHDNSLANQLKSDENEGVAANFSPGASLGTAPTPEPAQPLPVIKSQAVAATYSSQPAPSPVAQPSNDQVRNMAMQIVAQAHSEGPLDGSAYDSSVPGSWH